MSTQERPPPRSSCDHAVRDLLASHAHPRFHLVTDTQQRICITLFLKYVFKRPFTYCYVYLIFFCPLHTYIYIYNDF